MVKEIEELLYRNRARFEKWAAKKMPWIFIFNVFVLLLVLLKNAGYFHPYFPLTINSVVLMSLIAAIILLGIKSRALFVFSLVFWLSAFIFKIFNIDVWAERSGVYTFQSLFLGVVVLLVESIWLRNSKR